MRAAAMVSVLSVLWSGCFWPCGGAECPEPEPIRSEVLVVDLYDDTLADDLERTDVTIQGDLEIFDDEVILTYADVDGNVFQISWDRP